jgi:hypothetical protein
MDDQKKEDLKRMNDALLDQKTIEQLSSTGNAARAKRDRLKEAKELEEQAKADAEKAGKGK